MKYIFKWRRDVIRFALASTHLNSCRWAHVLTLGLSLVSVHGVQSKVTCWLSDGGSCSCQIGSAGWKIVGFQRIVSHSSFLHSRAPSVRARPQRIICPSQRQLVDGHVQICAENCSARSSLRQKILKSIFENVFYVAMRYIF